MEAEPLARIDLENEARTTALGQGLAPALEPGDVVLLQGPIGAGKTHLARAVIQARLAAAGRYEEVPSPTYTLVQTYADDPAEIWHADLYRLTDPAEVLELGLETAFETAIVLVEWPDRLGGMTPRNALLIDLETVGEARRAHLSSCSPKWRKLLKRLETA